MSDHPRRDRAAGPRRRGVLGQPRGALPGVCLQASPSYVPVGDSTTGMPLWAACCSKLLTLLSMLANWAGLRLPALILERRLSILALSALRGFASACRTALLLLLAASSALRSSCTPMRISAAALVQRTGWNPR